jgi:hypothetical protein
VVGEVLELHQHMGLPLPQACHEPMKDIVVCGASQPALPQSLSTSKSISHVLTPPVFVSTALKDHKYKPVQHMLPEG